jgi:hypothetical protein
LVFPLSSHFFSEPPRVHDLRKQYPEFDGIYRHHFDEAKFDAVNDAKFMSAKDRLTVEGGLSARPQSASFGVSTVGGAKFMFAKERLTAEGDLCHAMPSARLRVSSLTKTKRLEKDPQCQSALPVLSGQRIRATHRFRRK